MNTIESFKGRPAEFAGIDDTDLLSGSPAEIFGLLALDWRTILQRLDGDDAVAFDAFVHGSGQLQATTGNRVGTIVKDWAIEMGATHYAHWFQPLTGQAAEKHDAFLTLKYGKDGATSAIEELKGTLLVQGEPDASSFPSGGLRATHSARGYTLWDPKTPLFIRESGGARTLCIPCAYIGYTGHSLDHKTPLLRSLSALSKQGTRFLNLIGVAPAVEQVTANLGTEQEYFLIDQDHFDSRIDLVMTGRTLLGNKPSRNQQLEDHYFGVIPARVQAFMADAEEELYRLGVPVKTRHSEVAPCQFELAPIFESASIAVDHNVLTMEVLRRVAKEHGLVCLLHEKPFAGINGSGKHNNWSMATNFGENLLEPGTTPEQHKRFLAVLSVVLMALHRYAAVLRVTVASAGNDHRLGANEAPPPIISAYLGTAIDELVKSGMAGEAPVLRKAKVASITDTIDANFDATDRNRTAPFAFTGNKFEFRAVGSSDNCGWPMAVLNAAVAESFSELSDRLEAKLANQGREEAVTSLIQDVLTEVRSVCFEGDGYSTEWHEEAARRGLPILRNTPESLAVLLDPKLTDFLAKQNVLSHEELSARYEILAERYVKALEIEGLTMAEMATTAILPAVEAQLAISAGTARDCDKVGIQLGKGLRKRLESFAALADSVYNQTEALTGVLDTLHEGHDAAAIMATVAGSLIPAMSALRTTCDAAEAQIADDLWPIPKYVDMLFPSA
ncbi:MAG: glutamine synthetase III [Candidatus Sericytochromatia bacterium]|nr:glutamine synthetase III [Candidatus Sericytochromatia bacterium]